MSPALTLGAILVLPVLIIMILRINATLVFLSLCLGDVLIQFVAPDAKNFVKLFAGQNSQLSSLVSNNIKVVLLLLPVVLTAVFMIRSIKGHAKLLLNLFPAVGVSLLAALLIVPLLSASMRHSIVGSEYWAQIQRAQDLIVGLSSIICLLVVWLQRPKHHHGEESKHSKHGHHRGKERE
jgi:hypothetical protein